MSDVATPTGELLNNVNRLKTGNSAQLTQAAIPLPPSYAVPKLESKRTRVRGAGVVEDLKMLEKGVRGLDKVRMEEVYEGSFNFAHPGYRWVDDVRASVAYYGEGLGRKLPEDVQKIAQGGLDEIATLKARGWGNARHRAPTDTEKVQTEEKTTPQPEGIDWTLYSGVLLCGPFFFGLLLYGLYVRFIRRSSVSDSLDLGQELESDDDEVAPRELQRVMLNWRRILRPVFNAGDGGEDFAGGMSAEQIEKLPLVAHSDDCQCRSGTKFRCIICLSDVKANEMLREIPRCGHRFHSSCVDPWLGRSATCPLCRRDVIAEEEEIDEGVQQEVESVETASTNEPENLDNVPDSPTSSRDLDPATPQVADVPSTAGQSPLQDDDILDEDPVLPRSFGAASSEMDEWSEPEAPGSAAGVEVDGWEIIDGGS